jgi:hypothetical protein
MESRYRHPSRASLRAEQDRDARRRRHRQAGLALGTASVAAAGIAAAYRMLQNALEPKSSEPDDSGPDDSVQH